MSAERETLVTTAIKTRLGASKRRLGIALRQSDFFWRYVANCKPWSTYKLNKTQLNDAQRSLLCDLRRDGIALTTVKELMRESSLFEQLESAVWSLERTTLSGDLPQARDLADTPGFKTYLVELLGPNPVLDPSDIFVRFALQPAVLNLVNSYFGMYTRLRAFNVWHNFASTKTPRNSQLWHRDPEDRYILKMFVYLTDVTEKSGPLIYAPGTHPQGNIKMAPQSFKDSDTTARRSNDDQMRLVVPENDWVSAVGPKGMVVFADTRGYHKGGLVRENERVLYNCMFTSQASTRAEYFERKLPIPESPDKALSFALGAR
jgi:Phytanoyl-CoA dioxygenase (PhyH)